MGILKNLFRDTQDFHVTVDRVCSGLPFDNIKDENIGEFEDVFQGIERDGDLTPVQTKNLEATYRKIASKGMTR